MILYETKKYENIVIYDYLYKIFMGSKPLCIKFNKTDGFIKICNGIRYLILFSYWWYDKIFDD